MCTFEKARLTIIFSVLSWIFDPWIVIFVDSKEITSNETSSERFNCYICGKIFKVSFHICGKYYRVVATFMVKYLRLVATCVV